MSDKELLRLQAEYERQLREEGMRFYEPHSKQLDFHKSRAKKRGLFGGNQSGKSFAGAIEIAWTVGKVHPYRPNYQSVVYGRDCCVDFGVMQSVLIPTYKRLLPRGEATLGGTTFEGKPRVWPGLHRGSWDKAFSHDDRAIHLADGSFIEWKSYEQGKSNPDSFAGPPRHIIRMDEEPPQRLNNENVARQMTTGQNLIYTMTPLNYSAWIFNEIYEASQHDPDIDCFKMGAADNPYVDRDMLAKMQADITDPAERAARLFGDFTYVEGRVWKEYGDHNYIDPFIIPRDWHRSVIIDQHPQKPVAVNWIAQDHNGRLFVYREGDYTGDVKQVSSQIRNYSGGEYIDLILIDPSSQQGAQLYGTRTLFDEFQKEFPGILVANNNTDLGREIVRQMVKKPVSGEPKLFVFKNCPVTDFQMRNYSWKPPTATGEDRTKPAVVKRNDDHCDCVRYRCMATWVNQSEQFSGFPISVYGR